MKPSGLYTAPAWRAGMSLARRLGPAAEGLAAWGSSLYAEMNEKRRRIVFENILPAVAGDGSRAARLTDQLFRNFGRKLAHLWQYESGTPVDQLVAPPAHWKLFDRAHARGRGVVLVTPHLGNWEFGAPLVTARGIKLQVISFQEPHPTLGEMRKQGRERWGVSTVFIGDNPFTFVEVIRHLEAGGVVALLMDRPPKSASAVRLFNKPFLATAAAAELARATGCALLPVSIVWEEQKYDARLYDEVEYDRRMLRMPEARLDLTQRIISHFEPIIRERLDQWYHFVPVWNI